MQNWFKVSNNWVDDPKLMEVGAVGTCLFFAGLAYCSRNLTDGCIPKVAAKRLLAEDVAEVIPTMLELGLWAEDGKDYLVAAYLDWQTSSEEVTAKRQGATARKRHQRQREVIEPTQEMPVLDVAEVRKRVAAVCDKAVFDGNLEATMGGYRHVYEVLVPQAAEKYADVKGVGEASLLVGVVLHAATTFFGIEVDAATMRRLSALRRDYGFRVIETLPIAAAGAKGDPINYLTSILKKEKANA